MQSHSVRRTSVAAFSRTTRRILEFLVCGLTFLNILAAQSFPAGQPYKFVIPVSIDPNGTIVVNGITYSPPNGLTSGVNVVTFNRQSLAIVNDAFPTTSAGFNQYIDAILSGSGGQPTDLLVLIASINNNSGFALGEVASHLEKLGATNEFRNFNVNAPLAFIGHGGLSMNQAYQSATGPISGNFAQDVHSNYAFIPLDYIAYTLDPLGRTVSVGSQTWNDAQTCGNGGFFLVEFDRTNPQSSKLHKCYYTELGDTAQLSALRDDLAQIVSNESNGAFLISFGSPLPDSPNPDQAALIGQIAAHIRDLGGYAETFNALKSSDTYALVGVSYTPPGVPGNLGRASEASTLYPGRPSGMLKGALGRGRRGAWYSSIAGDLSGLDNNGFYAIVGQPATPYPHPANADELSEFQYLTSKLCEADTNQSCSNYNPRDRYADKNIPISNLQTALSQALTDRNVICKSDSTLPLCIMSNQLSKEFTYVSSIRSFDNNLAGVFTGEQANNALDLIATFNRLEQTVGNPPTNPTLSIIETVISSVLAVGSAVGGPAAPALGVAAAAFSMGTGLQTDLQGNSTAFSYATAAANLAEDAINGFNNQLNRQGTLFDYIYQDWGRVQALGSALGGAQEGSQWYWNTDTTTSQILTRLKLATERSYYQSLMAARYEIGYFESPGPVNTYYMDPGDGSCGINGATPFYLYHAYPDDYPAYPDTEALQTQPNFGGPQHPGWRAWLAVADQHDQWSYCNYTSPGPDIMNHLFNLPTDQSSGLGVYRPEFFNGWAFPHIKCHIYDGVVNTGCPWGSGTMLETLPPVASLNSRLESSARNGDQVRVRLMIRNTGSFSLQNITLDKIKLRVLAGSGEISLSNPTIPISIGSLIPGENTNVQITLNVPATVKKFSLIEEGTMDNAGEVSRFSGGQVVFP